MEVHPAEHGWANHGVHEDFGVFTRRLGESLLAGVFEGEPEGVDPVAATPVAVVGCLPGSGRWISDVRKFRASLLEARPDAVDEIGQCSVCVEGSVCHGGQRLWAVQPPSM